MKLSTPLAILIAVVLLLALLGLSDVLGDGLFADDPYSDGGWER